MIFSLETLDFYINSDQIPQRVCSTSVARLAVQVRSSALASPQTLANATFVRTTILVGESTEIVRWQSIWNWAFLFGEKQKAYTCGERQFVMSSNSRSEKKGSHGSVIIFSVVINQDIVRGGVRCKVRGCSEQKFSLSWDLNLPGVQDRMFG